MNSPLGGRRILTGGLGRGWKRAAGGGWWLAGGISAADCIGAFSPVGAASYEASLVDLSGTGNNGVTKTAPNWTADGGWDGQNVAGGLITCSCGYVMGDNYSVIVKLTNSTYSIPFQPLCGYRDNTNASICFIGDQYYTVGPVWYNANKSLTNKGEVGSGTLGMAGLTAFRKGLPQGDIASGNIYTVTDFGIFGATRGALGISDGRTYQEWKGKTRSIAIYKTVITDAQMLAVSEAMP